MPRHTRFIRATAGNHAALSLYGVFAEALVPTSVEVPCVDEVMDGAKTLDAPASAGVDNLSADDLSTDDTDLKDDDALTLSATLSGASLSAEAEGETSGYDMKGFLEMLKNMKAQREARYLTVKGLREATEAHLEKWESSCAKVDPKYDLSELKEKLTASLAELRTALDASEARAAASSVKSVLQELSEAQKKLLLTTESSDQEIIEQVNHAVMTSLKQRVEILKQEENQSNPAKFDELFGKLAEEDEDLMGMDEEAPAEAPADPVEATATQIIDSNEEGSDRVC